MAAGCRGGGMEGGPSKRRYQGGRRSCEPRASSGQAEPRAPNPSSLLALPLCVRSSACSIPCEDEWKGDLPRGVPKGDLGNEESRAEERRRPFGSAQCRPAAAVQGLTLDSGTPPPFARSAPFCGSSSLRSVRGILSSRTPTRTSTSTRGGKIPSPARHWRTGGRSPRLVAWPPSWLPGFLNWLLFDFFRIRCRPEIAGPPFAAWGLGVRTDPIRRPGGWPCRRGPVGWGWPAGEAALGRRRKAWVEGLRGANGRSICWG